MPVSAPLTPFAMLSMSFKQMANNREEKGHPCLTTEDGCTEAVLSPSNNVVISMIQTVYDGQDMVGHLATP